MSFVLRMVWRETRASWLRLGFFFLCVGLGVASITALRSVVQHVRTTLTREARSLLAADLVIQSNRAWTDDLAARVAAAGAGALSATTAIVDTQTMAASPEGTGNGHVKLVELRGVEVAFPFYGALELDGRGYAHELLRDHGALVQPELLAALDVVVGDQIRLAGRPFTIRGVITRDRFQRSGGIAFGPRVYVDLADLREMGILGFGSRATYRRLYRVDAPDALAPTTDRLKTALSNDLATVRSWQSLEDQIGNNLSIAENYLSLVGFAIVVLGGLGVWSVTRVLVQQKMRSVAILKCIGASGGRVLGIYVLQILVLALVGSLVGVGLAALGLAFVPASVLAPLGITSAGVTPSAAVQGMAVGLLVSLLFSLVPLLEIRDVKPLLLLRADTQMTPRGRDWRSWGTAAATAGALVLVAVWQAQSLRAGLFVCGGLAAIAGILALASRGVVSLTRPLRASRVFAIRHATISLGRPGNQTRVILLSVGLGCFFIVGLRAVEMNLLAEISAQVGERSPDLVLIDVQRDQRDQVLRVTEPYLRAPAQVMPLMRARVVRVEGPRLKLDSVDAVREHGGLGREFGLTFRDALEANERTLEGAFWSPTPFVPGADGVDTEVSVEARTQRESRLSIGDVVTFDAAGAQVRARVTSIREVVWEDSQSGGFVFVLRPAPAVLRAPHTYVGFLQVRDTTATGSLQRDLVRETPNVSVLDVRDIVASIREVVGNVTLGISVVGVVLLTSGILIVVGAIAMTKFQRVYETAIYRTLGAGGRLVTATMAAEYALLGGLAGLIGAAGGLVLSWALARFLFEMAWRPPLGLAVAAVALTGLVVTVVGVVASIDVLWRKPLDTLRVER